MEHIGEILRTAREDNFYTQKKVMELTGINRKTLSGYENSVAEPDLDTFARLLRLYQLSADEVLGIKTSTPPRIFPALTIYNELILCLKGEHFHERYW